MATSRNEFLLLLIHISEIFERSLGQLILAVAKLGLFPGVVGIVISLGGRRLVFLDWPASLVS